MSIRMRMDKKISRREFLRMLFLYVLSFISLSGLFRKKVFAEPFTAFNGRPAAKPVGEYDLVSVKGDDPYRITVKAVESMGGMARFVRKGSAVVIKPNIGWDRLPEQAGNTNPQVVAALTELAFKAGAKRVNVFDVTCNDARRCYASSGIEKAARAKGANVYFPDDWDVVKAGFGYESPMAGWPILRDAVECDTFINVPVLKHHALTRLTLSMKNLMGVCVGRRGLIHQDIGRKLVDLTDFIKPDLTVIDAYRVLVRNGPTGGSLDDVEDVRTVIVAEDPTLADAYASRLVDVDPLSIPYIKYAAERKFGSIDIDKARCLKIEV